MSLIKLLVLVLVPISHVTCNSASTNSDGSTNLNLQVPVAVGENNVLSVVGTANGVPSGKELRSPRMNPNPGSNAIGAGLAIDNINGHGLSLTGQHIPGFGDKATAAARLNLINTQDHKLDANAFVTRTMPKIPDLPNLNTHGASLEYSFKDKVGCSLGVAHTNYLEKTDFAAMGNLNLYRDRSRSVDLNAGFTKSRSPISAFNHDWAPQAGLYFTVHF